VSWLVLVLALPALAAGAALVWRRPLWALYAFAVGLALHNAVFLGLWLAGARGWQLTVAQSWKEVLLATALLSVAWAAWRALRLPVRPGGLDLAVLALALVAVVYALLPQDLLGGEAGLRARAYGLREVLIPVAAYALGRSLSLGAREWKRLGAVVLGTAGFVAVAGLIEVYAVPLSAWRDAGAAGYFTDQLGFPTLRGPAGLPENFALNTSDGVFRRLVSTFLSPLATAYMLLVALLVLAARSWARRWLAVAGAAVLGAAFLLAFSRAAAVALVGALLVLAVVQRRLVPAGAAAVALAAFVGVAAGFTTIAAETRFFPEDLPFQEANAEEKGDVPGGSPLETTATLSDPSSREHLEELERGLRNFAGHPQGYGLGNAGVTGQRYGTQVQAGESTYLVIALELGAAGLAALLAVVAAVLVALWRGARRAAGTEAGLACAVLLAAHAAIFAIGIQTQVLAVPWIAYVLWSATGAALTAAPLAREVPEGRERRLAPPLRGEEARLPPARTGLVAE
jgi:hypothetical protein